jgi:nucleotide-binding universal stress UspA family protein
MTGFRRVVVGYDGSGPACDALALAQRLMDPREPTLVLAHVDAERGFRVPRARAHARDGVLAAGREEVRDGVEVISVERSAASAARGLIELAEEEHADLLVLGAHHAAPVERVTPGPTALRLLEGGPCALAIAPPGLRDDGRFQHVGVAYDGSPEAKAALGAGYGLAGRDAAAVSLFMTVLRGDAGHAERIDEATATAPPGVHPHVVLLHGDPAQGIARASEGTVDVLFAGSRGHGPPRQLVGGSVSQALLVTATQPVVILPRGSLADGA